MKAPLIYFGSYTPINHLWFSPGANTKIRQTLESLKNVSNRVLFINYAPNGKLDFDFLSLNSCRSYNPILYSFEILFSLFSTRDKELRGYKQISLLVYNPRFTSLLIYVSSLLCFAKVDLFIQVEDIPCARSTNLGIKGWIDQLSFKILSKRSKHIFYASPKMLLEARRISNIMIIVQLAKVSQTLPYCVQ